jgi:peptide/nickel transport system permease protein
MHYLLRRLGFYVVTAWAAITLNFFIPRLMPGNPVAIALSRFQGQISPQAAHSIALLFGLSNKSLIDQYGSYWVNMFHGNLGISLTYYPATVSEVIRSDLPWTLALIGVCTVIGFAVGTGVGIVVGWRRGSWLDSLLPVGTIFSAIPYFWLGLLAIYIFGEKLAWFPVSGGNTVGTSIGFTWTFISSALYHAVLPAATIILVSVGGWMLGMRNMMVSTIGETYVVMAQAKGLSTRRVMVSYAARNAIIPSVASFALSIGFVVGGAVLVEIVFSYPGIGYALYQAVTNEDYPLVQGIFLVITLAVLIANLLADVLYVFLDPRAREAV